jgi:acetyl esterase/lipase
MVAHRSPAGRLVLTAGLILGLLAGCTQSRRADTPATAPPSTLATTTSTSTTTPTSTTNSVAATVPAGPPYPLGQVTLRLVDPSRPTVSQGRMVSSSRTLTTPVWFPSRSGRWPLVVFAHGFQVGPAPYTALLEAWAAHGYVVAAPEFPLTDQAVAGPNLDESDLQNQPADVRFVTDQLLSPSSPLAARIDPARVAVAGHSDGAETALAASTDPVPAGEPPYRAVMVLSGQPVPGAADHNPPILVAQGDADTINPPDLGYATWDQAAAPRFLLVMHGAGHLPAYQAGTVWFPAMERVTEAFLDVFVAGDEPSSDVARSGAGDPAVTLRSS